MPRAHDVCDEQHTSTVHVKQVESEMPDSADLRQVVAIFAALAVPTRARIVFALSQAELCVCDLAELADMSMSAVSHQLRLLRQLGLVKYRKEGRLAYYSLDDEHASGVLAQVLEHVRHRGAALRVPSRTAFKTRLPRRPRIRSKGPH